MVTITQVVLISFYINLKQADTMADTTVTTTRKVEKENKPVKNQWTKQLGTSSYDEGYGVTTDSSGNIYVTGSTDGGLDGNTNSGSYDIFLVKYNSSGIRQ